MTEHDLPRTTPRAALSLIARHQRAREVAEGRLEAVESLLLALLRGARRDQLIVDLGELDADTPLVGLREGAVDPIAPAMSQPGRLYWVALLPPGVEG